MAKLQFRLPNFVKSQPDGTVLADAPAAASVSPSPAKPTDTKFPLYGLKPVSQSTDAFARLLRDQTEKPYGDIALRAQSFHDEALVPATSRFVSRVLGEGEFNLPPMSGFEYKGRQQAIGQLEEKLTLLQEEIKLEESPAQPGRASFHNLMRAAAAAVAQAGMGVEFSHPKGERAQSDEQYPMARVFHREDCWGNSVTWEEAAAQVGASTSAPSPEEDTSKPSVRRWKELLGYGSGSRNTIGPKGVFSVVITACLGILLGSSLGLAFGWLSPTSLQQSLVAALSPGGLFNGPLPSYKLVQGDPPVAPVLMLLLCLIGYCIATVTRYAVLALYSVVGEASAERKIAFATRGRAGFFSYALTWIPASVVLLLVIGSELGLEGVTFHRIANARQLSVYMRDPEGWRRAHGIAASTSDDGEGSLHSATTKSNIRTPDEIDEDLTAQVALFAACLVLSGYIVLGAAQGFKQGRDARFRPAIAAKLTDLRAARDAKRGVTPVILAAADSALAAYDGRRQYVNSIYAEAKATKEAIRSHESRIKELEAARDSQEAEVEKNLGLVAVNASNTFESMLDTLVKPAEATLKAELAKLEADESASRSIAQERMRIETEEARIATENARRSALALDRITREIESAIRGKSRAGLLQRVKSYLSNEPDSNIRALEGMVDRIAALRQDGSAGQSA